MNDQSGNANSSPNEPSVPSHLDTLQSECRALLSASVETRANYCFEDKYVLYDEVRDVLATLKDAFHRPRSERPAGFALVGPSSSGKTALANRFGRDLSGDPGCRVGTHSKVPLVISKFPPRPDEGKICLWLARTMGIPVVYGGKGRELSDLVLRQLAQKEVRMVIFHEFNNVKAIPASEREVVYGLIKDLNSEGIVVVVVGTERTVSLIQESDELVTRLKPLRLCGFAYDTSFVSFIKTMETYYPLPKPSGLVKFAEGVHRRTFGVVGEVVSLLNESAAWAIRNGQPTVDETSLSSCRYIPPALRPSGGEA